MTCNITLDESNVLEMNGNYLNKIGEGIIVNKSYNNKYFKEQCHLKYVQRKHNIILNLLYRI